MWKRQILGRAIRIQKANWGNHTKKKWKESAIHYLYFKAFLELWLLNYLKNAWSPTFSFLLQIGLAKVYFLPLVITFAKIPLY